MSDYTLEATWDLTDDWDQFTVVGDSYMSEEHIERPNLIWRGGCGKLSTAAGASSADPYVQTTPTANGMARRFARWQVAVRVQSLVVGSNHQGPFQILGKNKAGGDLGVIASTDIEVGQDEQEEIALFFGSYAKKTVIPPDPGPGVEISGFANTWMIWDWALQSRGETEGDFDATATANIYIERLGAIQPVGLFKYTGDLSTVYEWTGFRFGIDSMNRGTESFVIFLDEWRIAMDSGKLPGGKLPIARSCPLKTIR